MLRPADVQQFHAEIRADRHAFLCRFHGQLHETRGLLFAGGDELVYLFPVFHLMVLLLILSFLFRAFRASAMAISAGVRFALLFRRAAATIASITDRYTTVPITTPKAVMF